MSYYFDVHGRRVSDMTATAVASVVNGIPARLDNSLTGWRDTDAGRALLAAISVAEMEPAVLLHHEAADPNWIMEQFPGIHPVLFREWYQFGSLLSKFTLPSKEGEQMRRDAAFRKFDEVEAECSVTNALFEFLDERPIPEQTRLHLHYARKLVRSVLGPCDIGSLIDLGGFGPGASVSLPRRKGDLSFKFGNPQPTATYNLEPFLSVDFLWRRYPCWHSVRKEVRYVEGNEVTTVPKSNTIDRPIAIEPDVNQFLQRGVGTYLRRRLLRVADVDLDNQDLNQILAFSGSISGQLATLDLSSASDSVSHGLVKWLLPVEWYNYLGAIRSPVGSARTHAQKWVWEKFSSMGNGFTFELESLIFWALARSVIDLGNYPEQRLGIYGDDIIVSVEASDALVELLRFCGFNTNRKKSFSKGGFRESCGSHFFDGYDVTPVYIRKDITGPQLHYIYHNLFLERGIKNYDGEWRCPIWTAAAGEIRAGVRGYWNLSVPCDFGHTGFWTAFDEARPVVRHWRRNRGYADWVSLSVALQVFPKKLDPEGLGALCKSLFLMEGSTSDESTPWASPDKTHGMVLKRRKAQTLSWCDLPPLIW